MKDHFKNLSGDRKGLSPKKQAMRELIVTPHAVIISASAIRLEKRIKDAEKHNRGKERYFTAQQQTQKTLNFEQRTLEKHKTRQKKERRMAA